VAVDLRWCSGNRTRTLRTYTKGDWRAARDAGSRFCRLGSSVIVLGLRGHFPTRLGGIRNISASA
jgi:hypothetical protein